MSDTPTPNDGPAPVPLGYEPLEPAEDFGSDLVAEFGRRASGSLAAAADDAEMERQIAAELNEQLPPPAPGTDQPAPEASTVGADGTPSADEPEGQPPTPAREAPAGSMPAGAVPADGEPVDGATDDGGEQPAEVGGYVWQWTDQATQAAQAQRFTDDQVQNALRIAADQRVHQGLALVEWASQLNPEQREAMGHVADGTAVTVARADYDRYQAWLHQQTTASRLPSDIDQFDPEAARLIREQQDQIARLEAQQPQQPQPYESPEAVALARSYNSAIAGIKQTWQLTDAEMDQLYTQAQPFVAGLQVQHSQFNPLTGQLLRPADPNQVMYDAFSFAISRNPALHEAVLGRARPASAPTGTPGEATPAQTLPARDISGKRARAASMASAPSAAVTPAPRSVKSMSEQELNDAMAAELTRHMNGDGQMATV